MRKIFSLFSLVVLFTVPTFASGTTCDWDPSSGRRLLRGSGCMEKSQRICSGYVICETDGLKTTRLATCSSKNCSNAKATACAMEQNYGSRKPQMAEASKKQTPSKPAGTNN